MSYLTLVQDFCTLQGLPSPAGVVGNTSAQVRQLATLVKETLEDLQDFSFQQVTARVTWTAVAGDDQGTLESLFGTAWAKVLQDTLWNTTHMQQFYGPLAPQDWNALQTHPTAGISYYFTVLGGSLLVYPELAGGETLSAMVTSKALVEASSGGTLREYPTADDDTFRIPEAVVRRWLKYRWKQTKGEAWAAAYDEALSAVAAELVTPGQPTISLSQTVRAPAPGVLIPAGSWNVS